MSSTTGGEEPHAGDRPGSPLPERSRDTERGYLIRIFLAMAAGAFGTRIVRMPS